jgi:hypothetical protein
MRVRYAVFSLGVTVFLSCSPGISEPADWADPIRVSFDLIGTDRNELTKERTDSPYVDVTFTNVSASMVTLRLLDGHHPDSRRKLPYPMGISIRYEHADGTLHSAAQINGEWMTQYLAWSELFHDWPLSEYRLGSKDSHTVRVALRDVFWTAPLPEGWITSADGRFRPGSYTFRVRYLGPGLDGGQGAWFDGEPHESAVYLLNVRPSVRDVEQGRSTAESLAETSR